MFLSLLAQTLANVVTPESLICLHIQLNLVFSSPPPFFFFSSKMLLTRALNAGLQQGLLHMFTTNAASIERGCMCVREHADIMGQLPDPASLGGETQARENAYQLKQFRWKQIVTSPDAPFTQGEERAASTTSRFFSPVMPQGWPSSWGSPGWFQCGRLDFRAGQTGLSLPTLLSTKVLCTRFLPSQDFHPCEQLGGCGASAFSIPEHLCVEAVRFVGATNPEVQHSQKTALPCKRQG